MISILIISFSLLLSSSCILSDDYLENLSVNTGETATFICDLPEKYSNKQADFYGPMGRLLITKIDADTTSGDQTRFILEHTYAWTWSLTLSDVSDDDAGEYTCRVSSSSNDQTLTIIKRFNLTVLTPPKIIDITIESNHNEILKENQQIILKCTARGIPQPNIIWYIPGKKFQLNKRNDRNIIIDDNKLLIKNLSRTTPIDYQCIADNGIPPRDTRTKRLFPSILPELSIQSSIISTSHILVNCTVYARPLNSAKWKRNRFEINNIKRKQINDYTVELILLLDMNTNIYGMYECEAENQFKVSKAFINIDETFFYNATTTTTMTTLSAKYHRTSSPSYAQIELLLNQGSICKYMALFILCGNDYSSVTRMYMLSLIILVFVCSFSYCSSFDSSNTEIGNNVDVINDNKNLNDENNKYHHRLFYRQSPSSSGNDYLNAHDNRILSKDRLLNLLLQSALNQEEDRPHRRYPVHIDNRRYAPQSFHAMRG